MIALIGVHRGPRQTLEAAAPALGPVAWAPESGSRDWRAWLRAERPRAVLRGTSELPARENPEALLARAAAEEGIPVFAVEDFPGNFQDAGFHPLAGLFVEFEWSKRFHRRRGLKAPVHVTGNPRYASKARTPRPVGAKPRVLWLGQPDESVCEASLALLAPAVAAAGGTLARRRHPRAGGGGPSLDEADLVATSFSSLAVEAGFLGIPALFLLLPGLGAAYLRRRTGARELPWPEAGAAFAVTRRADLPAVLRRALEPAARRRALTRFRALHRPAGTAAARIASLI